MRLDERLLSFICISLHVARRAMAAARVDESMTIETLKPSEGAPSVASFTAASASSLPVMPLDWQWTGSTLFGGHIGGGDV